MKKLIVFMFSVVLLGSCGKEGCTDIYSENYNADATKDDGSCIDQRFVRFSVERTSAEPTFTGSQGGAFGVAILYNYSGGGGISAVSGVAEVGTCDPNWTGVGSTYENNSYDESDPVTMIKNDNVSLQISYGGIYCDYTGSYVIKAHVFNNEIIIEDNYSPPPSVDPNGFQGVSSINWIVP